MESPSINNVREAKSPTTGKARALRRESLTGLPPPPGSDRRSSLGSTSTDARKWKLILIRGIIEFLVVLLMLFCYHLLGPTDSRNAKTPPSVHSSTKIASRWM